MQVVRHKVNGKTFEIGTKNGAVLKFREGLATFDTVLDSEVIWKDIGKGDRASDEDLQESFATTDVQAIALTIVNKGVLQLTEAERKQILTRRRNEIVTYIHKYYVDPKTKTPHPTLRIDNAITDLKYRVDPDVPTEKQVAEIMKNLPGILPVKKMEVEAVITIPHAYIGNAPQVIKDAANIRGENYTNVGCEYTVTMIPGNVDGLMKKLATLTRGEYDIKIEGGGGGAEPEPKSARGGRGGRGGRGRK